MATFVQKEKNGSLFRNSNKTKETSPDWNGEIMLNGKLYWLSAWEKQGAKGQFFSVALGDEKKPKDNFKAAGSDEMPKETMLDDQDIPF